MILPEDRAWIDGASYGDMLARWRFAPLGDPMFYGETGDYFRKALREKRLAEPDPAQVSKDIGWEDRD